MFVIFHGGITVASCSILPWSDFLLLIHPEDSSFSDFNRIDSPTSSSDRNKAFTQGTLGFLATPKQNRSTQSFGYYMLLYSRRDLFSHWCCF